MKITYKTELDNIDWKLVSKYFEDVEWGERDPHELKHAFTSSSHVRFAFDGEMLVGFGRTIDDGKYYAMIVDLVISPKYQGNGIGGRILFELRESLKDYIFTTLTSAVGKEGFYLNQGWQKQKTAFIWPSSETQKLDHAKST